MIKRVYFVSAKAQLSDGTVFNSWSCKPYKSWIAKPLSWVIDDMLKEMANRNSINHTDYYVVSFSRVK